ncbi:homeobox protein NANOG [Polymixia lowei]
MADWKAPFSYNYNQSYHAYAYGIVYQPGPEQNHHANLSGWGEHGVTEVGNYHPGVNQAYYTAAATAAPRTEEQSPPRSPEQIVNLNGVGQYQGSSVVFIGDAQAGRHQTPYHALANESDRARSDSPTSDSEAPHPSPDSWSSGSSREGSLPQIDPATWAKNDLDNETDSGSPDASEDVSSITKEPQSFTITGNEDTNNPTYVHVPPSTPKKPSTAATGHKAKARAAFSVNQMNALLQRFNIQRYLTPSEMKSLAGQTGLTYKQVKTWFQNRRMKLRRHQKDTSWVSEHYTTNKDSCNPNATHFTNMSPHIQAYQGEARTHLQEQYNHQAREAAVFKKTPSQNLAYYLAAMGGAGSAGYPSWPSAAPQTALARPHVTSWPMTPAVAHYDYNPNTFSTAHIATMADTSADNTSFDSQDGDVSGRSPLHVANSHQ